MLSSLHYIWYEQKCYEQLFPAIHTYDNYQYTNRQILSYLEGVMLSKISHSE